MAAAKVVVVKGTDAAAGGTGATAGGDGLG